MEKDTSFEGFIGTGVQSWEWTVELSGESLTCIADHTVGQKVVDGG